MNTKIIFWNCQGAEHPRFSIFIKEYKRDFIPNLFCLMKTRISGEQADDVIARLWFSKFFSSKGKWFYGWHLALLS